MIRLALRVAAAVALAALIAANLPAVRAARAATGTPPALDLTNLDRTCAPCDDFWRYATGGWQKRTTIPPGYSGWGAFYEVYHRNLGTLRGLLDAAARDASTTGDADRRRIGVFYAACMDTHAIDAHGFEALQPEFDRINAVATIPQLVAELGRLERLGVDDGLDFGSEVDNRDSSRTIGSVGYGGLGMPDRDDYLTPDNAAVRAAYLRYLKQQLANAGEGPADAARHARAVFALEASIARATPPRASLRDPLATYHPMSVAHLETLAPHVAWRAFFAAMDQPALRSVDVNLPAYETFFDAQLAAVPIETWQAYLRTRLITTYAIALPHRFDAASFAFYDRTLNGVTQQRPRWQRCVDETDGGLPDPLGKEYVAAAFPPEAKARALALVDNLQHTLHDDIATLPWMAPATRAQAETKLAAYGKKIGYPDRFVDFSAVVFAPDATFLADRFATQAFATQRDLQRIGKPTDRTLWDLSPPTVNAYYSPNNNEIVFPAGILQPPFFSAGADDAVNYGAIGAVMGHEMTHGFDDQGRKFDAKGNLRDWWTPADAAAFRVRAQCIVDEFNGDTVLPGVHENGQLVQGEAIADLGGATIAYRAFTRTAEFKAQRTIDGFTPQQRFFLAYAQIWRALITPAEARQDVLIDPHPENRIRVLSTLGDMPAFQAAFACARNAPMIHRNRCAVW